MSEPTYASAKAKRLRKKHSEEATGLPHEMDSVGRSRAATRILVKLPRSTASAPTLLNESTSGAEIPELGDTRATTADGTPLPIPFNNDANAIGSELPSLQTVSSSSLSGVEPELSERERRWRPNSTKEAFTTS
ncbi:hypothetical protein B0H14DRAFT_2578279 [Mycena olivaceomarginata]|nr:hypothetical protein B0H14DRAFT_2578279 [Mycena olivaceomarginata]